MRPFKYVFYVPFNDSKEQKLVVHSISNSNCQQSNYGPKQQLSLHRYVCSYMTMLQPEFCKVQYTYLGSEVGGWSYIFMLGFHCSPRMVYFETFIAIACTAVHATLCGLLRWWFAEITHNSNCCPGCLSVPFHNGFQREVAK